MRLKNKELEQLACDGSVEIFRHIAATGELNIEASLRSFRKAVEKAYQLGTDEHRGIH